MLKKVTTGIGAEGILMSHNCILAASHKANSY